MISAASFFSSSTMTWERIAARFRALFLLREKRLRRAERTDEI